MSDGDSAPGPGVEGSPSPPLGSAADVRLSAAEDGDPRLCWRKEGRRCWLLDFIKRFGVKLSWCPLAFLPFICLSAADHPPHPTPNRLIVTAACRRGCSDSADVPHLRIFIETTQMSEMS